MLILRGSSNCPVSGAVVNQQLNGSTSQGFCSSGPVMSHRPHRRMGPLAAFCSFFASVFATSRFSSDRRTHARPLSAEYTGEGGNDVCDSMTSASVVAGAGRRRRAVPGRSWALGRRRPRRRRRWAGEGRGALVVPEAVALGHGGGVEVHGEALLSSG